MAKGLIEQQNLRERERDLSVKLLSLNCTSKSLVALTKNTFNLNLSPASKASVDVTNLTDMVYGVKEFVCLSVCLSVYLWSTMTPIISGLALFRSDLDCVFRLKSNF